MSHGKERGGDQASLTEPARLYWHTDFSASQVRSILGIEAHPLDYWTKHLAEHPTLLSPGLSNTVSGGSGTWRAYQLTDIANLGLIKGLHVQPTASHNFALDRLVQLLVDPPNGCDSWARLAYESMEDWDDRMPFAFLEDGDLTLVRGWYGVAEYTAKNTTAGYVNLSQLGREIVNRVPEAITASDED